MSIHGLLATTHRTLLVGAILIFATTASHAAVVYSVDDGARNANVGASSLPFTLTAANQFTVVAGGETIQSILIAWGTVANGTAFTARLWSDPNGDGNPSDAVQLSSLASTSSLANTSIFVLYDIPDVTLSVGERFFVGFTITHQVNEFPLAIDTTAPISNQSWGSGNSEISGAGNLGSSFGDAMIRANGDSTATAVPEPSTFALFGIVLAFSAGCFFYRRQRSLVPVA